MKGTPFFKFDAMSWLGGSIQFATLEEKGLFIDIAAMYWKTWKPVEINERFKVRYRYLQGTLSDLIGTLSNLGVIVVSEAGITVPFLDEMIDARVEWLEKCSKAGKKSAARQGTSSNKKEERRKKKEEKRKETTIDPTCKGSPARARAPEPPTITAREEQSFSFSSDHCQHGEA